MHSYGNMRYYYWNHGRYHDHGHDLAPNPLPPWLWQAVFRHTLWRSWVTGSETETNSQARSSSRWRWIRRLWGRVPAVRHSWVVSHDLGWGVEAESECRIETIGWVMSEGGHRRQGPPFPQRTPHSSSLRAGNRCAAWLCVRVCAYVRVLVCVCVYVCVCVWVWVYECVSVSVV